MVALKACGHFKALYGDLTMIVQGDFMPWNAWFRVYENGRLIYNSYETGLFQKYLVHLKYSDVCRWEVGLCLCEIEKLLREIELEWEAISKDC